MHLSNGIFARAAVPSGASTGMSYEHARIFVHLFVCFFEFLNI